MDAEEKIDNDIWNVLVKIKELNSLSHWRDGWVLNLGNVSDIEKKILFWLQDEKSITLLNLSRNPKIINVPGDIQILEGIKIKLIQPMFDEVYEDFKSNTTSKPELLSFKLTFSPKDGIIHYRGADYQFRGKSKALMAFLVDNKNTPFPLEEIKVKCNPNISNERSYFKEDKDMRDIVNYIRKCLKVKKGEYFPIQKRNNNWIWEEK